MVESPPQPAGEAPHRPDLSRKRLVLPTLLSLFVAALLTYFFVTHFEIDLDRVWKTLRGVRPGYYLLAIALYYLTFPIRGLRWRLLLESSGAYKGQRRPSILEHSQFILMNWLINAVALFRLGDAYRAYDVDRRHHTNFSRTIGTILAERVMDVATIFPLLLLSGLGLLHGDTSGAAKVVIAIAAGLALATGLVIWALWRFGRSVSRRLPTRINALYDRFYEGAVMSLKHLPLLLLLSTAAWLLEAGRLYFVIIALDLHVSLGVVLFAALAYSILTTIPFTPGGLGIVESGLTGVLVLVLDKHSATTVTLLDRSITYLSIIAIGGLLFVVRYLVHRRKRAHEREAAVVSF